MKNNQTDHKMIQDQKIERASSSGQCQENRPENVK